MLAAYSSQRGGYLTLHPIKDLGDDLTVALARVGITAATFPLSKARGYAFICSDGSRKVLSARDVVAARRKALTVLPTGRVSLCRAVARGASTLYERLEELEIMSPAEATRKDVRLVAYNGVLVEKALNVYDPTDARTLAGRLAGQLRFEERKILAPKIQQWLDSMDYDWTKLTPAQFNQAVSRARTGIYKALRGTAREAMPLWKERVETTVSGVMRGARKTLRANQLPSIGLSLSQPELMAADKIGTMNGWFIRDAAGRRSDLMTAHGRRIVQEGLKQGLGRDAIARQLRRELPNALNKYGLNYFKTLSANAVSRARSYAEINGYVEAGIEALEIQAILDERTTEICRCLDGQIIEVHLANQQMTNALNVKNPEDIYEASPFLKTIKDKETGIRSVVTHNYNPQTGVGAKIADITRSGMGNLDDRGQHNYYRMGNQLTAANIGPPPYHHLCRSWTLPVTTTVQVPAGTTPIATGLRPAIPTPTPPKLPPIKGPAPVLPPGTKPKPPSGNTNRPITSVPTPAATKPTAVGKPDFLDQYAFSPEFYDPTPPAAWTKTVGNRLGPSKIAAYHPYVYVEKSSMFRASGQWQLAPSAGPNPLSSMTKYLQPTDKGVAVFTNVLEETFGKQLVLNEAAVTGGNIRVYSIKDLSGKVQFWRFDHNFAIKADAALAELSAAETRAQMRTALANLEKKGFLRRSSNAADVMFYPKELPKPMRARLRGVMPQPATGPVTIMPKPAASVIEPKVPGFTIPEAPKPGRVKAPKMESYLEPAKNYSEPGLVKGKAFEKQVARRIDDETNKLREWMKTNAPTGTDYSSKITRGKKLQEYIKMEIGASEDWLTTGNLRKALKHEASERAAIPSNIARIDKNDRIKNALISKVKAVTEKTKFDLYRMSIKNTGPRLRAKILSGKNLPMVVERQYSDNAYFSNTYSTIALRGRSKAANALKDYDLSRSFRHEMGHFFETLGRNREAAQLARQRWSFSPKPILKKGGGRSYQMLRGKWYDTYCGRVYAHGDTEIISMGIQNLGRGKEYTLELMHRTNDEHVGFIIAVLKGSFI